jgi:hypothetical protein
VDGLLEKKSAGNIRIVESPVDRKSIEEQIFELENVATLLAQLWMEGPDFQQKLTLKIE